jgi:hypothetical protein
VSEPIESDQPAAAGTLRAAVKAFSSQAVALNRLFSRTLKRAVPDNPRFHQDMRVALRAQAQYRATLKMLLELEDAHDADEKTRISRKQTIGEWNSAS